MNTQVNDPKGAAGALKAPMHLIPPYALEQTAWVQKLGSEKYGPYNWRKTGVCASTYVSAIMRHLNAWRDGEDLDPESGISHIAHIASSCNILLDAGHCGTLQDDRNKKPVPNTFAAAVAEAEAEAVKDESVAPEGLLPFPPVPEGYSRWAYRGRGWSSDKPAKYAYRWSHGKQWHCAIGPAPGGYEDTHYIEAVKEESVALDQRDLPIPSEWTLPQIPEGYDRWVYRGTFEDSRTIFCTGRHVLYGPDGLCWLEAGAFSLSDHIEAVKDEPVAPDGLPPLPPVPEGYARWVYRGKGWKTDRRVCFAATTSPYIEWVTYQNGCTVGYENSHYIEAVKD